MTWIILGIIVIVLLASIRQVDQYERGVKFTMGRFTRVVEPGWRIIIPIFQSMRKVDMRVKAVDVPYQDAITKDNVSAKVNAVIYYRLNDASKAVLEVENFWNAMMQLAQTTMRNVIGELELDELLAKREVAAERIKTHVYATATSWGIEVGSVELKDILLPEEMQRVIAKQAEAERQKRAVIIESSGEVLAAENLSRAAAMLAGSPGALHLRTLNSINDISSDKSNTVVFAVPLEVLRAFEGMRGDSAKK
ncbi:MAG: slipin family protein [Patescibacteria group bacterium]